MKLTEYNSFSILYRTLMLLWPPIVKASSRLVILFCIVSMHLYSASRRCSCIAEQFCAKNLLNVVQSNSLGRGSNSYSPCYSLNALTNLPPCHTTDRPLH